MVPIRRSDRTTGQIAKRRLALGSFGLVALLSVSRAAPDERPPQSDNEFTAWGCTSAAGFDTIRRLDIAPLGQHPPNLWKDSLFADLADPEVGGYPRLFFTWGDHKPPADGAVFSEAYAEFVPAENRWKTVTYLADNIPDGGVSSHDGSLSDYVFNEYRTPGWGPYANRPGTLSTIPGVSNEHTPLNSPSQGRATIGYPLMGTGPLGITTIRAVLQNRGADDNTRTCLQMNPSLFTDRSGRPSMVVTLFTVGGPPTNRGPCRLPGAQLLPADGNYLYHYEGATLGWQLDVARGLVGAPGNDAVNAVAGTSMLLGTQYGGLHQPSPFRLINSTENGTGASPAKLQLIDAETNAVQDLLSCTRKDVHFGEASGDPQRVFFLADYAANDPAPFVHDIYVAYRDTVPPAPQ